MAHCMPLRSDAWSRSMRQTGEPMNDETFGRFINLCLAITVIMVMVGAIALPFILYYSDR